jgi:hypothetical protein
VERLWGQAPPRLANANAALGTEGLQPAGARPGILARRRVAKFVDEEADASSGASADEAAEADADGDGFLRDFIDDGTQAAGGPGQCAPRAVCARPACWQATSQTGNLARLHNYNQLTSVKRRGERMAMYHRSMAEAALASPACALWPRGPRGGCGGAARPAAADTPGARSDSGYDLEDSFLDEGEGARRPPGRPGKHASDRVRSWVCFLKSEVPII